MQQAVQGRRHLFKLRHGNARLMVAAQRLNTPGVRRIVDAMRLAEELPPMASALRRGSAQALDTLGWAAD